MDLWTLVSWRPKWSPRRLDSFRAQLGLCDNPLIWRVLERCAEAAAAKAVMEASIGQALVPHCTGMARDRVPIHKGCKQGAPESPVVWYSCSTGRWAHL